MNLLVEFVDRLRQTLLFGFALVDLSPRASDFADAFLLFFNGEERLLSVDSQTI